MLWKVLQITGHVAEHVTTALTFALFPVCNHQFWLFHIYWCRENKSVQNLAAFFSGRLSLIDHHVAASGSCSRWAWLAREWGGTTRGFKGRKWKGPSARAVLQPWMWSCGPRPRRTAGTFPGWSWWAANASSCQPLTARSDASVACLCASQELAVFEKPLNFNFLV